MFCKLGVMILLKWVFLGRFKPGELPLLVLAREQGARGERWGWGGVGWGVECGRRRRLANAFDRLGG